MRKSILLIGIFAILATVALLYALQQEFSNSSSFTVNHHVFSHSTHTNSSNVQFEWKLGNPYILKNGDGNVFLDIRVSGKAFNPEKRKPMNLVLVIDRSGSMGSESKLDHVKNAAASIIDNMGVNDRLAVVIYDDAVQTLIPSSAVENKEDLKQLVYSLTPGGSTNLFGGLHQGAEEVRKNFREDAVNRIVLLSDGLANAGISDPDQIEAEAKTIRENSVSVSTMGVGVDYNENLMAAIADHSGGNYYYISSMTNMAEIFRREWSLMQNLVATTAKAIFELGEGVSIADVAGYKWTQKGGTVTIEVPDVYSGETKRILVQLQVPTGSLKTVDLGQGEFICDEISGGKADRLALKFHPSINVTEDQDILARSRDGDIEAKAVSVLASKEMEEAYKRYEAGDRDAAYKVASETLQKLEALGYVQNEKQVLRYQSALNDLQPSAPPPTPSTRNDFLKKNKAADRASQQSTAQ